MNEVKEKFDCFGTWWQPDDPEDKIHGTLSYTYQNGLKLELKGVFRSNHKKAQAFPLYINIILGQSEKGEKITLFGCAYSGRPKWRPIIDASTILEYRFTNYYCSVAYISHHFVSEDEIKFKSLNCSLNYLDDWLGVSGFTVSREVDNEKKDIDINIRYSPPEPIIVNIDDEFSMAIYFYHTDPGFYPQSEVNIRQYPIVSLEANSETKLSNFLSRLTQIRFFLSLAIMKPIYPYNFSGEIASENLERYECVLPIYMQLDENIDVKRKLHQFSMLFTYAEIQDNFGDLLQKWFEKQGLLEPVIDSYFSIIFNPGMPINNQFLGSVQAIESYHRRFKNNNVLTKPEFEKKKEGILSGLNEDQRKWLEPKLEHANEPSLYTRLKDLFSEHCELGFIFGFHRDLFARKVADTRNYHTHYNKKLKKNALSGTDLIKATQQLKAVIQYLILLELGFTKDDAQKLANKIARNQFSYSFTTFNL